MDGLGGDEPNETNKIKSEGLQFVFSNQRDNFPNPVPYYDDGNPDMYSKENMEKRKNLKDHHIVRNAIEEFIQKAFTTTRDGNCTKEDYFQVFMKIGVILRPGIEADNLNALIKEDWEHDCEEKPPDVSHIEDKEEREKVLKEFEEKPQTSYDILTKDKLQESLFTLADAWCPSIEPEEYAEFFQLIQYRLKYYGMQDNSAYDVLT